MRPDYLLRRLKFRLSIDGPVKTFKDLVFINREIVIVEKDITSFQNHHSDESIEYSVVDLSNSKITEEKFNLPLFHYYACNHCKTLIAVDGDSCLGFIRWTMDNNFTDLQMLGIELEPDEAYMFDFFLFPECRGSSVVKDLPSAAISYLKKLGLSKFYGYYFSDNLQALWWHRAFLHADEIKKVKTHRFLSVNIIDGKLYLQ